MHFASGRLPNVSAETKIPTKKKRKKNLKRKQVLSCQGSGYDWKSAFARTRLDDDPTKVQMWRMCKNVQEYIGGDGDQAITIVKDILKHVCLNGQVC